LQVIQFGKDLTLAAICGETVVDYSLRLQKDLKADSGAAEDEEPIIWVAGYSNNVFGYLPSLRILKEGGYEGGGAMTYTSYPGPFTDSVEKRVVTKIKELTTEARKASQ